MSFTTTSNVLTTEVRQVLNDYEIHVSRTSDQAEPASRNAISGSNAENPPHWPQDHHRIPPYRPINHNLEFSERPAGSNGAEQVFIRVMFTGVALNAGMAQIWGKTGGKAFTRVFRYAIGGEW